MCVELGRGGREEAAAREDAALEVREKPFAECLQSFERVGERPRGVDDLRVEDLAGGLDGRELQLLLRAEVRIEPALAHADVRSELADRETSQALDRGEIGGATEDRPPAAFAICAPAARPNACPVLIHP